MRILFISSWWPTRVYPTHGNFVQKHARLVASHHDLKVLAIQEDDALRPFHLQVTDFREKGYSGSVVYYGRPRGKLGFLHLLVRLRAYYAGLRRLDGRKAPPPDVVHGHVLVDGGIVAAAWSIWWNRPAVITEHASVWSAVHEVSRLKVLLARWAVRQASFVLPVSRQLGHSMRELYGMWGAYRPISNVVDETLFCSVPSQFRGDRPLRLLHISNFDPRFKNLDGLLRVYAQLQRNHPGLFHLTVAGDGPMSLVEQGMAVANLTPDTITVHGKLSESEVARHMQEADVFVLFSDVENQPVVLLEAQCCGLPCVATRVGGVPDIVVEGKTGYLVDVGDESGLSRALIRLAENYSAFDRYAIGQRARSLYGTHAVAESIDAIYRDALKDEAA